MSRGEALTNMAVELYGDIRSADPAARVIIATALLSFCLRVTAANDQEFADGALLAFNALLATPRRLPPGVSP